jgi:rare lipoprotein A
MRARKVLVLLSVPCAALAGEPAPSPYEPLPMPPRAGPLVPKVQNLGSAAIIRDRLDGHTTASGELYNRNALAAAHRTLPFGTTVRVTNMKNQRSVVVRINDRGAGIGNRIIDLTPRAAAMIGLQGISVGEVRLDVLASGAGRLPPPPDATLPAPPAVK